MQPELDHRQKRVGPLVEARPQAPVLLQPPNEALDCIPACVLRPVEHRRTTSPPACFPGGELPLWDHRPDAALA